MAVLKRTPVTLAVRLLQTAVGVRGSKFLKKVAGVASTRKLVHLRRFITIWRIPQILELALAPQRYTFNSYKLPILLG